MLEAPGKVLFFHGKFQFRFRFEIQGAIQLLGDYSKKIRNYFLKLFEIRSNRLKISFTIVLT